jgi:hypothetical protein
MKVIGVEIARREIIGPDDASMSNYFRIIDKRRCCDAGGPLARPATSGVQYAWIDRANNSPTHVSHLPVIYAVNVVPESVTEAQRITNYGAVPRVHATRFTKVDDRLFRLRHNRHQQHDEYGSYQDTHVNSPVRRSHL